jgi:hypothetical protein
MNFVVYNCLNDWENKVIAYRFNLKYAGTKRASPIFKRAREIDYEENVSLYLNIQSFIR